MTRAICWECVEDGIQRPVRRVDAVTLEAETDQAVEFGESLVVDLLVDDNGIYER